MTWLLLVLISTISFSVATLLQRVLLQEEQSDPIAYGFVFQLLVAVLVFIYALFSGFTLPDLRPIGINLAIMTVAYALFNWFLFKAYQKADASEVSVLTASRVIWSVLTAVLFLSEQMTVIKLGGILVILVGVIIIMWRQRKWRLNKGHLYALIGAFFFGVAFTNDAYLIDYFGSVPTYLTISFSFPAILLLAMKPSSISKLKLFLDSKRLTKMGITSFLWGLSALTIFFAYQVGGQVIQLVPISQFSIVLITLLAYIFLKEKENMKRKIFGAVVMFVGVILLL